MSGEEVKRDLLATFAADLEQFERDHPSLVAADVERRRHEDAYRAALPARMRAAAAAVTQLGHRQGWLPEEMEIVVEDGARG